MTNADILFLSLVGSKNANAYNNLNIIQNELQKHVLPTFPFTLEKNDVKVNDRTFDTIFQSNLNRNKPVGTEGQFFPLGFKFSPNGNTWYLPYEPMISVSGKNIIERVDVARINMNSTNETLGGGWKNDYRGSIKQTIRPDDYEITITGVLFGENESGKYEDCFPKDYMTKLLNVLHHAGNIWVECPLFELLNISKIVVMSWNFPFTKGENVQAFEISALSDSEHSLLIES